MATFRQRPSGIWQAQVERRGVRKSQSFDSLDAAKEWAAQVECAIKNNALGVAAPVRLTGIELTALYVKAKENARLRGIDFLLNRDDVVMLYARSNGRCQVTGIVFNRFRPMSSTKRPWFPSLDRIDSAASYTFDNCRIVCVAANFAMGEWGAWVMRAMANSMIFGHPGGSLTNGKEAPAYEFGPVVGEPTSRQRARRKARADSPHTPHGERAHPAK